MSRIRSILTKLSVIRSLWLILMILALSVVGLPVAHGVADHPIGYEVVVAETNSDDRLGRSNYHGLTIGHCATGWICAVAIQPTEINLLLPDVQIVAAEFVQDAKNGSLMYGLFRPPRHG